MKVQVIALLLVCGGKANLCGQGNVMRMDGFARFAPLGGEFHKEKSFLPVAGGIEYFLESCEISHVLNYIQFISATILVVVVIVVVSSGQRGRGGRGSFCGIRFYVLVNNFIK